MANEKRYEELKHAARREILTGVRMNGHEHDPGEQGATSDEKELLAAMSRVIQLERQVACYHAARVTWPEHVLEAIARGDVEACKVDAKARHANWALMEARAAELSDARNYVDGFMGHTSDAPLAARLPELVFNRLPKLTAELAELQAKLNSADQRAAAYQRELQEARAEVDALRGIYDLVRHHMGVNSNERNRMDALVAIDDIMDNGIAADGVRKLVARVGVLREACERIAAAGCGGYNNHAWSYSVHAFEGGLGCERCGITPAVAEEIQQAHEALANPDAAASERDERLQNAANAEWVRLLVPEWLPVADKRLRTDVIAQHDARLVEPLRARNARLVEACREALRNSTSPMLSIQLDAALADEPKAEEWLASKLAYAKETERLAWTEALAELADHHTPDGQEPRMAVMRAVAHVRAALKCDHEKEWAEVRAAALEEVVAEMQQASRDAVAALHDSRAVAFMDAVTLVRALAGKEPKPDEPVKCPHCGTEMQWKPNATAFAYHCPKCMAPKLSAPKERP